MLLKRPVILAAALLLAGTAVRSQGVNLDEASGQRPAPLFADAPADSPAAPAATEQSAPNLANSDYTTAGKKQISAQAKVEPWALSIPKPADDAPADDSAGKNRSNEIDLSALLYFAGQGDLARVAAEIRLLRAKHPGWEPPDDLFAQSASNVEFEKPLWDLFAKRDYEGVRAGIQAIQDKNPDWQPSSDLTGKLALAEANDNLIKASDARQWGEVIDIAAANKMLLTCADVDAIWRTAEALARTDDEPRAAEAYRYILTSCAKREERLATIQKASQIIKSPDEFESLLRLGRRLPSGASEFDSVRFDLIRQKVGAAAADEPGSEASQNEIDALSAHARNANDRNDQQLLGWYAYSHKDFVQAETWFGMALRSGPEAKAAEGLVLTLRGAGKLADAQKLAVQYASLGHLNNKLMIEVLSAALSNPAAPQLSPDDIATLTKAIDDEKSPDGAQLFAWRLYNANDVAGAETWFRKSADWQQTEAAAIGLAVTARRLNDAQAYAEVIAKYRDVYPKIAEFDRTISPISTPRAPTRGLALARAGNGGWDKNAGAIAKTLQDGDYRLALAMLEERRSRGLSEPAGLSIVHGWALYQNGDWEGAKRIFASLQANGQQADAAADGLAIIQHRELPPAMQR